MDAFLFALSGRFDGAHSKVAASANGMPESEDFSSSIGSSGL